ncbi:FN3 associated domain-containing protein [Treponema saccharophilum]|uniref:FN3 associated domain-containing protein n=1 Tax=Treponema saccharophilum TaxID=165 RepID=UPI00386BA7F5
MKSLKKIFAGMFVAAAAFGFFGCSDEPEEDESLVVSITGNQNIVTIAAPDEYDGKDVKIVYTIDGTEPSVKLNSSKTDVEVTGNVYSDPFEITENTTIKARGYYFDSAAKTFYQGPVATSAVAYKENSSSNTDTAASATPPTSAVTFKMASTGNSNTVKYFDTANSAVFKYGDKNAYYQIQFSWKGTSKGNWYLYMREVGGGVIANGSNKFIAKGTYTGSAFDKNSATEIQTGDSHKLTLINEGGSTETEIVIAEDKSFSLKVGGVESAAISSTGAFVGDAK